MDSLDIYRQANDLVQKYGTRNTLVIAEQCGIRLYREPLGSLLGMYTCQLKHRIIFLNSSLGFYLEQMVCGHEIGHDRKHRRVCSEKNFQEFSLFNMKDRMEYEANAFAAHLLLDDEDVKSLAADGLDVFQMAQTMNSDTNLMLIKLQEMQKLGSALPVPCAPDSRFFRKLKGAALSGKEY